MTEIIINGPVGRLQAKYHQSTMQNANIAVVLHPHPVHKGTMNNKVVYTAYKAFVENNFSVIRFNFRGVEESSGEYDHGIGELIDAAYVFDWLQQKNPYARNIWISGFSFGAWVGMQLVMRRPEVHKFIAISPPINNNKYDFSFFSPCPVPGLIVQGDMDSVVSEKSVSEFVDKLNVQTGGRNSSNYKVNYNVIGGADHFFRNHQDELYNVIDEYIKEHENDSDNEKYSKKTRAERKKKTHLLDDIF